MKKEKATSKKKTVSKAVAKKPSADKVKNIKLKVDREKFLSFSKSAGKVIGLLLILLLVDFFVQYLNNDYSVAIVNGQRVPRREYVKNLETMYGAQIADLMVEEELVRQLGEKEDVDVNKEDVDEAYAEIEMQLGGKEALESALVQNNMTEEELRGQLENELVLKAIIKPRLEYTEEDLSVFFEEYKELLYEDPSEVEFEDKKDEIENFYVDQKTFEERDVVLRDFRDESVIQVNIPGLGEEDETGYGFFKATRNLISNFIERNNTN